MAVRANFYEDFLVHWVSKFFRLDASGNSVKPVRFRIALAAMDASRLRKKCFSAANCFGNILVHVDQAVARLPKDDANIRTSGKHGRNVIAAAKRGARAIGVEFNPQMVELSRQNAAKAGVGDKATFVEGDMYEADVSQAFAPARLPSRPQDC